MSLTPDVSLAPDQIRGALERIVASPGFVSAGRLGPFLTFLVERALAGQPIKESIVGVEAFGRPPGYDPRLDPIVRVEARRLRSRLAEYYRGPGAGDAVRITLPKGTYVPTFEAGDAMAGDHAELGEPRHGRSRRRILALAGAAAVIVGAGAVGLVLRRDHAQKAPPSVAVLPFETLSEDTGAHFGEGLTEEIIDRLARIPGVRVAPRGSSLQSRDGPRDLRAIGRGLGATAVVEGSVRTDGDRLRVTARLVSVEDGYQLWSHSYERTLSDVFDIQDDIASSIAAALRVKLNGTLDSRPVRPTASTDAYSLYLRGRYHLNHDAFPGLELAADSFEQAVAIDPHFAAAHASLAVTYALLAYSSLRPADEAWTAAVASAKRALAIDPAVAEAHAVLGAALAHHEWKWKAAEPHFKKAIELAPESSDVRFLYVWGVLLPQGRFDEALPQVNTAVELDPDSSPAQQARAWVLFASGHLEESIGSFRRAAELNPSHPYFQWDLGMALAYAGHKEEAMRQFRLAGNIEVPGTWDPGVVEHVLLGETDEARAVIARWPGFFSQRPILAAYAYGLLGDAEATADWLERACDAHDPLVVWVKIDPRFAKVRAAPRVQAVIRRIGL